MTKKKKSYSLLLFKGKVRNVNDHFESFYNLGE